MLFPVLVIALLIAVNALYVAAEFAAVAVQKSQIALLARSGNRRAAGLLNILGDGVQLDRYIAACQIGITLSSLVVAAYGQATLATVLGPWLGSLLELGEPAALSLASLIVLLVLTTLQVVLGELVPKSLALQYTESTALLTYVPMRWSLSAYRLFIALLNGTAMLLLKLVGVTPGGHQHVHSPDEIGILLAESRRGGELSSDAYRRLERGLRLSGRTVRQMMTPRSEIYGIEASTPPDELLHRVLESPYSRLPVYRGTLDHVMGAVHTKDVVGLLAAGEQLPPLEKLLRPIPFVPEFLHSHQLVRFLHQQRSSKAMVVDEYGGVHGIISIEDLLAELFGELGDELKQPEQLAEALAGGEVRLPGTMRLDEAEPFLHTRWVGPSATVGGHIVTTLGRLPEEGEELEIDGVRLTVTEMSPTAVRWITLRPPRPGDGSESAPGHGEGQA